MIPYVQFKPHLAMKYRFALPVLALALLAAAQPLLAASKADARAAALVAALQTVSPDPLGGQLGLEVSIARTTPVAAIAPSRKLAATQSPRAEYDHRTYLIWKSSQKS